MRCVKGDKVEVVVDEGEESHSHPAAWRCAEIISDNGHTYTVRYECCSLEMGATVETVPEKAVRPCPPRISPPSSWAQGDVAEVFEKGLWRLAHVSMVLDGEFVYVRCRGSCKELLVHLAKLRVPQIWQDSRWIVIKKLGVPSKWGGLWTRGRSHTHPAAMGYVKGDKVEVVVDDGEKSHSHPVAWRCPDIISANGHTYTIRYECCSLEMGATMENVPRKAIRPCPRWISPPSSWAPGDVAEVFEKGLWRLAHVSRALDGEFVYVRRHGSRTELLVHLAKLRLPQIWQQGRWIVIEKESDNCDDEIVKNHSKIKKCILKIPRSRMDVKKASRNSGFSNVPCAESDKHCPLSRKSLKKRPRHGSPFVNPCDAASGNLKAARKEGGRQERIVSHPCHLMNKVEAAGENCMHASFDTKLARHNGMGMDRRELEDKSESVCSSVGSCNPISYKPLHFPIARPIQNSDFPTYEAGSSRVTRKESFPFVEEALAEVIHRRELDAYRSTLLAFYASGALTWERQALLSNLRSVLHISDDEYLLELIPLLSAKT